MKFLNYIFPKYVEHLLLISTHKCNSRCVMCNIWKEKEFNEMSLDEIKNIFSHKIFLKLNNVTFSGGEALLREDLIEVIKYFLTTKKDLKGICIATNGLAPNLILAKVKEMLKYIKEKELNVNLWIQISCDGPEADEIRGIPAAFEKINSLIDSLNELRKTYDNLHTKIVFLTLPINFESMGKIVSYAEQKKINYLISHLYVSGEYYKNDENINLVFSEDQTKKIVELLEHIKYTYIIDYYYYNLVKHMYLGKERKDDCAFLSPRSIFIESNGDVPLCMHSHAYKLGNIRTNPNKNFWKGDEYKKARKSVIQNCCKCCKNSCGFSPIKFPSNLFKILLANFRRNITNFYKGNNL